MSAMRWPDPIPRRTWWALAASIGVLAFAASFNGIWNDFAYDDLFIIYGNRPIHILLNWWRLLFLPYWPIQLGGDGYRPLTLMAFMAQWVVSDGSPMFFHAVTIALYVATSIAAFWLASLLLEKPFAWIVAALFAVHPVHVEAVANVVGQAEVWVGLLLVCATALYIEKRRAGALTQRTELLIGVMYLAACLFKEHGVVLPFLLLAADALVVGKNSSITRPLRDGRRFYVSLVLLGCLFVVFRQLVIGKQLAGYQRYLPFQTLDVGYVDRVLTMLGVVPHWLRLLLWPETMTSEYGPPQYPTANGVALWQLPGLLILVGVLGLGVAAARRAPVVSFGIAWLALTLLPSSNLIIPSGILLAERTLFAPSLGAMLALGAALPAVMHLLSTPVYRTAGLAGVGCVLWLGVAKSIIQTAVWRDNTTLFLNAMVASPGVYRSHYMMAATLMNKQLFVEGEREYLRAIELFPYDPSVTYNLGLEYFRRGYYDEASRMHALTDRIMPRFMDAQAWMAASHAIAGRYPEAALHARRALEMGRGDSTMLRSILVAATLDEKSRKRMAASIVGRPPRVIAR